jgi:hypothetical protein
VIEPTPEMEQAYDDAAWEHPVELGGLEMANVREGLAAVLAIVHSPDPHIYLSTACLHGDHAYCQVEARRYDGSTKTAATCKFCASPCICPCHRGAL